VKEMLEPKRPEVGTNYRKSVWHAKGGKSVKLSHIERGKKDLPALKTSQKVRRGDIEL